MKTASWSRTKSMPPPLTSIFYWMARTNLSCRQHVRVFIQGSVVGGKGRALTASRGIWFLYWIGLRFILHQSYLVQNALIIGVKNTAAWRWHENHSSFSVSWTLWMLNFPWKLFFNFKTLIYYLGAEQDKWYLVNPLRAALFCTTHIAVAEYFFKLCRASKWSSSSTCFKWIRRVNNKIKYLG